MKKLFILIILVVISYIIFDLIVSPHSFNQTLNKLVRGNPNKGCSVDQDCSLKQISCLPCVCFDVVNDKWDSFCPLKNSGWLRFQCKVCPSEGINFDVKCVENQCQRVWK